MGCSNVQNFSTRSYFWEKRLSSKTFNGPWPPNSLVWWPKIYISIEGYSRPFQRCMTLHISMLYMVGRASERSFQKWDFLWTTKFWTCWCCFRRLEAVQNIFLEWDVHLVIQWRGSNHFFQISWLTKFCSAHLWHCSVLGGWLCVVDYW